MAVRWMWWGTAWALLFASCATGQDIDVDVNAPTTTTTDYTVTVTPRQGESLKDFHFRPPKNSKLAPTSVGGLPSGWTASGETNDGINVHTTDPASGGITNDGPGGSANDSLTFTLSYTHGAGKPPDPDLVFWAMTSDGDATIGPGDVTPGPNKTKPSDVIDWGGPGFTGSQPGIPAKSMGFRASGSLQIVIGGDVLLPLGTNVENHVYAVHTSIALSSSDPDGLGIDREQPIPENWGIVVSPERGMFVEDAGGNLVASPVIRVPNDSNLVGLVFYATASLDFDGNGRPDIRTPVRRFTIQAQGSSASGIEDLPESD